MANDAVRTSPHPAQRLVGIHHARPKLTGEKMKRFLCLIAFCLFNCTSVLAADLGGQYKNAKSSLGIKQLDSTKIQFSVFTSHGPDCSGVVENALALLQGNQATFVGENECKLSIDFSRADKATVREENCSYYHGAACSFDGRYLKVVKPSRAGSNQQNINSNTVAVMVGGDPDNDACGSIAEVRGLDPKGDDLLSVRKGPGRQYEESDRLHNGQQVYSCGERGDWVGIVYGKDLSVCNVAGVIPKAQAYRGPCHPGWVHKKWLAVIAG